MVRKSIFIMALVMSCVSAQAKEIELDFSLPSFSTANYHNPYVAIWLEGGEKKQTLMLWHLKKRRKDKWLVDIRRWWRKQGRYGKAPDAVTGATKGPDNYKKKFNVDGISQFNLFIEVVREDGGRSLLKQAIDFNNKQTEYKLPGDKEIGPVTITIGN